MFKRYRVAVFAIGFCGVMAIIMYVVFFHWTEEAHEPAVLFLSSSEARVKIIEHQDPFILDVRSNEEFIAARVPGSVNIPYLMITRERALLPDDRHTLIFVYCRTGRRAAIAVNDLMALGYTNIIVFPGMETWGYETVSG